MLENFVKHYETFDFRERDLEEVLFSVAHRHDIPELVSKAVAEIVRPAANRQTIKNAFTAGFLNSAIYSSSKILKMIRSFR